MECAAKSNNRAKCWLSRPRAKPQPRYKSARYRSSSHLRKSFLRLSQDLRKGARKAFELWTSFACTLLKDDDHSRSGKSPPKTEGYKNHEPRNKSVSQNNELLPEALPDRTTISVSESFSDAQPNYVGSTEWVNDRDDDIRYSEVTDRLL